MSQQYPDTRVGRWFDRNFRYIQAGVNAYSAFNTAYNYPGFVVRAGREALGLAAAGVYRYTHPYGGRSLRGSQK